jgi:transcription initiation factor TFIID TATA-box-binding protein
MGRFIGMEDFSADGSLNAAALAEYEELAMSSATDAASDPFTLPSHLTIATMAPNVVNIVASADLGTRIDLHRVASSVRNAEWNPRRFHAVILRITEPKATALVFECGKLNVVGCRDEDAAHRATRKFTKLLKKLDFPVKIKQYNVVNIVATISCGFHITLEAISTHPGHRTLASYNPEVFAGVIYKIKDPRVTLLIFASGKIIMTGAKNREMLDQACAWVWPILKLFEKVEMPIPEDAAPIPVVRPVVKKKKQIDPFLQAIRDQQKNKQE